MARPQKEGMDYFPHDVDAVNDEKIEILRMLHGNDGYVFYFVMLERIYRTKDFELNVSDAETKEEMFQILSRKMMLSSEEFYKILTTAFKYKCFDKSLYDKEGIITSSGIKKRASTVTSKRAAMKGRYEQKKNDNEVSDAETKEETMEETPQVKESKGKKRKGKKRKGEKDKDFLSDSNEYRLSSYLFNFIKRNNGKAKEPNFQSWCKTFDLILRVDGREIEEIKKIIKWTQEDEFWCKNVLSPTSLKKHYDKFVLEIKKPVLPKKGKPSNDDNLAKRDFDPNLEGKLLGEDKDVTEEEEIFDNKSIMEKLKNEAMNKKEM
jgi:hypothetical protein